MLSKPKSTLQIGFFSRFEDQLNQKHPLYLLSNEIHWHVFENAFEKHYSLTQGKPAKPIRLMVSLLILKQLRNLSDESVVEQWSENSYYQYFSGEQSFTPKIPCVPTELVELITSTRFLTSSTLHQNLLLINPFTLPNSTRHYFILRA